MVNGHVIKIFWVKANYFLMQGQSSKSVSYNETTEKGEELIILWRDF